jgi:predicted ATP-dependent protease
MLRVSVVNAVQEGKFHIYAISTVDEGLEVLTGHKAKAVHKAAKNRLTELAQTLKEFTDS